MARYTESHHIILCGDFNRTGRAPDYDNNINVLNERSNEDGVINKYGRSLLNFCINTELKIADGRMFDDKGIGRYTYYSPMRASTIDYVILRKDHMISKFKVLPKLVESDHCPIKFHILNSKLKELISFAEMSIHVNDFSPGSNVYIWQDKKKSNTKHLHGMSRHVLRLKNCYVLQLKGVTAIIYVIFSMVC